MTLYRTAGLPEDLVAPVMIAAFDGWVDAASAASATAEHLSRGGELIATFDADVLYDYRSRRPVLDIIDGTLTRLTWPSLELHRVRAGGRDLLLLHGAEPDFRWRQLGAVEEQQVAAARARTVRRRPSRLLGPGLSLIHI